MRPLLFANQPWPNVWAPLLALSCALACSPGRQAEAGAGGHGADAGGATGTGGGPGSTGDGDGAAGQQTDDRLFVPESLPNTNLNGQDEGLVLVAFTLVQEASGASLYAAVRNDADTPLCQPGMTTDFYDRSDQLITSVGSVVQTDRLYRLEDGTILSCMAPGQVAMTAAIGLPDIVIVEELAYLKHLFPAFILQGIVPIPGLAISDVQVVATEVGHAYAGKLDNGLDVAVGAPHVTVFPLNRVGRPLGVATSDGQSDLPAGGTWSFRTNSVKDTGAGYAAFPSASLLQ
jgi:hypothetical protein